MHPDRRNLVGPPTADEKNPESHRHRRICLEVAVSVLARSRSENKLADFRAVSPSSPLTITVLTATHFDRPTQTSQSQRL